MEGGSAEEVEGGSVEVMQIISIPAEIKQKVDHNILPLIQFTSVLWCFLLFLFHFLCKSGFFTGVSTIIKHKCMAYRRMHLYSPPGIPFLRKNGRKNGISTQKTEIVGCAFQLEPTARITHSN